MCCITPGVPCFVSRTRALTVRFPLAVAAAGTKDDVRRAVGCPLQISQLKLDDSCRADATAFCDRCVPQILRTLHPAPETVCGWVCVPP